MEKTVITVILSEAKDLLSRRDKQIPRRVRASE
jgi:hypothetical protein